MFWPGDDFVPHDHADPGTCPFCGSEHIQGKTPFVDLETEPGSIYHERSCDDCGGIWEPTFTYDSLTIMAMPNNE